VPILKYLVDGAIGTRATDVALRAARKLEALSVRTEGEEKKGDSDRGRVQVLESQIAALELRVAELERGVA
jgi:hypothetical protein